jgi:hypothetical protein
MLAMTQGGRVAPYTAAETAEASTWLAYIDGVLAAAISDPAGAIVEAIDKAQRRAGLSAGAAALLAEIFDVAPAEQLQFA